MSELQIGLLAIGVLVVVVILAYNKWQERRYRRLGEQSFGSGHEDVLLKAASDARPDEIPSPVKVKVPAAKEALRIEPSFSPASPTAPIVPGASVPDNGDQSGSDEEVTVEALDIDEVLDFVVEIRADVELDGSLVIDTASKRLAGFTKPVGLEGFNEARACWSPFEHAHQCKVIRVAVQMVDRHGMLSASDLERFAQAANELAANAGASAVAADSAEVARRAQLLDQFCNDVDIQIALNVVPNDGLFSGTRIRALAEASGFKLESDGRFRRRDEQGQELFVLSDAGNVPFSQAGLHELEIAGLMFEFDVPRVRGEVSSFNQLARIAGQFATTLGGRLVDDNRADLGPAALAAIAGQLEPIYSAMSAQGIPAGSPRALRLFS